MEEEESPFLDDTDGVEDSDHDEKKLKLYSEHLFFSKGSSKWRKAILFCILTGVVFLILLVVFSIGIAVGHFAIPRSQSTGFTIDASKFFIFLLTLTLTSITATCQAFAVSSRLRVVAVANLLIALSFVLFMLFGGFLIALSSLPEWLQWIKYLSLFRYSLEAMSINEINGMYFCPNGTYTERPIFFEDCTSGTLALENLGYSTDQMWLWYDQVGLAGLSLIFLFITYLNLLTTKKLK